MKLEVLRVSSQEDSTSGLLFDVSNGKRKFLCYTLEDEHRDEKVMHETRIPAGTYKLELRTEGGFHNRYKNKYGFHEGMIWVKDVPGFEYILWHTGNTDEHTSGCLIVGQSQESNLVKRDGFVGSSVSAYKYIYPYILAGIKAGPTEVTYVDYDGRMDRVVTKQDTVPVDSLISILESINDKITKVQFKLDNRGRRLW